MINKTVNSSSRTNHPETQAEDPEGYRPTWPCFHINSPCSKVRTVRPDLQLQTIRATVTAQDTTSDRLSPLGPLGMTFPL